MLILFLIFLKPLETSARKWLFAKAYLVPSLFLIYINGLTEGLTTNVKLFADNPSLFSVVYDTQRSAKDLNKDLKLINNWAFQWKMNFNQTLMNKLMKSFLAAKQKK